MPFVDAHRFRHDKADIFLSYSTRDHERVRLIADKLSDVGFRVFVSNDLGPGVSWRAMIDHYLNNSDTTLVCWSQAAVESEWVIAEAEYARQDKRLVACKIA